MKKSLKNFIGIFLCTLLAVSAFPLTLTAGAEDYTYSGNVIYISDGGDDNRDGKTPGNAVKTIAKAVALGGSNPTIVITDSLSYSGSLPACTLAGLNSDSVLNVSGWAISLSGDVTVKNLKLNATTNHSFILAQGHTFISDENVVLTANSGIKPLLSIRGGGDGKALNGNSNLIIKSGNWNGVYGGTRNADVVGNTYITIYDTASINVVKVGNDSEAGDTHGVLGNAVIKLLGSKVGATSFAKPTDLRGQIYLDLTDYTGTVSGSLASLGAVEIKNKDDLSMITTPVIEAPEVKEPPKAEYEIPANAIYLSDNGNDSNDGKTPATAVKTFNAATVLGGTNPVIAITDEYTISGKLPACTITGINAESVLNVSGWSLMLSGDVTVENITINALTNWSFILAMGYTFTSGDNVRLTAAEGVNPVMSIRGGGEGSKIEGDTNIVIKSGNWNNIFSGTKGADVMGNAYLTIYDTAEVNSIKAGNDSANAENGVKGNSVIKLVGSKTGFKSYVNATDVDGTIYFDLTDFTGDVADTVKNSGATLITSKDNLPEFIVEKNKVDAGVYDLPADTTLIFLSDSGDDTNDGKTIDTPKKTLNAAQNALGEVGGTVVITGTYTHNGNSMPNGPVSFTSTDKNAEFIWNNWALFTNNATFSNLKITVAKDYAFFLHGGTPLTIGKNMTMENAPGIKYGLGVRAGEKGDYALTDITIESGYIRSLFTGTKNGNILGDANVTISGGTVDNITCGNDSTDGRILGNTTITLTGTPTVTSVTDKAQYDGYIIVDLADFKGSNPGVAGTLTVVRDASARVIPINAGVLYINGYPDGTFLPDKVMTRAEAITVVSKLCGLTEKVSVIEKSSFTDVVESEWYIRNVKYLEAKGILDFYGTELSANTGITRGEFVKLISKLVIEKDGEAPGFSDVSETHKYYNEIILAAKAGLVNGYPDGTFLPDKTLTRAEIVTILNRLARRNAVEQNALAITKFSDLDGHWAKVQVIAASCDKTNEQGYPIWYIGDKYSENTPFDNSTLETPLVDAVLSNVDKNNSAEVMTAVETYAAKRREEIRNTLTSVEVTGTKYYVSNSGSDINDGKTPETAWKTLEKVSTAALAEGDGVFFKRGDTFRGQLQTKKGVTYSAYGTGQKPNLYGSLRNYSETAFWYKTDKENVYVSKEAFDKDVGLIVFDHGKEWTVKQIDGKKNYDGVLRNDLELYHSKADKKLYLYSVSDPNTRWTSTEIAEGRNGITGVGHDVTIDNLCVKYVGAHGVGYGDGTTGLTVQNCEFGWIGGMIQRDDGTRYGNAVEIYVTAVDYTVDNCYIYEVYDAGITHQYYATRDDFVNMENIKYINNVIEKCTYNIEYINIQPEGKGIMKDVIISGNLLLYGGEGWGQQRPDHGEAVIMGGNSINYSENYKIIDNVIHTSDPDCDLVRLGVQRLASIPVVSGNLFIGKEGNRFGIYGLMSTPKQIYDATLVEKNIGLENNTYVFMK